MAQFTHYVRSKMGNFYSIGVVKASNVLNTSKTSKALNPQKHQNPQKSHRATVINVKAMDRCSISAVSRINHTINVKAMD